MDLNFLREPSLILFSTAMFFEAWMIFSLFFDVNSLKYPGRIKWTFTFFLLCFSSVNLYAFQEVYFNQDLTNPLITKMMFSFFGLCVVGCIHMLGNYLKNNINDLKIGD